MMMAFCLISRKSTPLSYLAQLQESHHVGERKTKVSVAQKTFCLAVVSRAFTYVCNKHLQFCILMKVAYFLYIDDELLLRDLSKTFVVDQLSIGNLIALQPDAASYAQG